MNQKQEAIQPDYQRFEGEAEYTWPRVCADSSTLRIRTVLNGAERQNYPVSDMFFPPARLVSLISRDITLVPGDLIACGTSVGVGVMRDAENLVEIAIDGVGTLANRFDQPTA